MTAVNSQYDTHHLGLLDLFIMLIVICLCDCCHAIFSFFLEALVGYNEG